MRSRTNIVLVNLLIVVVALLSFCFLTSCGLLSPDEEIENPCTVEVTYNKAGYWVNNNTQYLSWSSSAKLSWSGGSVNVSLGVYSTTVEVPKNEVITARYTRLSTKGSNYNREYSKTKTFYSDNGDWQL